jgi:hypothetical protein
LVCATVDLGGEQGNPVGRGPAGADRPAARFASGTRAGLRSS